MRFVGLPMVVKYPSYDSGPVQGGELGHEAAGEPLVPATVARQASSRQPTILRVGCEAPGGSSVIDGIRPRNRHSTRGPAPAVLCQWP
jgi:hypothetical protein